MKCKDCRWWNAAGCGDREEWNRGQCRRHAPTSRLVIALATSYSSGEDLGHWPETAGRDGCGDFERLVTTAETPA